MNDYAVTAQFYDPMAAAQHDRVDRQIRSALEGLAPMGDPIVDIGAGTGLTVQVIAGALPDAEILAVEPDPSMRSALMTRVWADPGLRRRVSILPMSIFAAPLPSTIAAAVASASAVHFSPDERRRLWGLLARRLAPTGCILVEVLCPTSLDIPEIRFATVRVGRIDYQGWSAATRIDDRRQKWRMTYVAAIDDTEIDRQITEFECWVASPAEIIEEAAASGLRGAIRGSLVVLRGGSDSI
ncbi:MAG: class I SAM-dependent methyltransferase [Steroidobacteraceae bacterium]|jgi:trans-aconitate methyltransferase|nr:class I SAM-dependent methyltransferase [Steroidobacteraceae bacterium]